MEELKKLSDKFLHCLGRTIQDEYIGDNVKCLYCKYAIECAKEFQKTKKLLWIDIAHELETCTSVKIFLNHKTKTTDILKGSWLEGFPEMLNELTGKSLKEQMYILRSSRIKKYLDNSGKTI